MSTKLSAMLAPALEYAERGLHVFPCAPKSKIPPKGSHGLDDATTDAAMIRAWWTATPEANIDQATVAALAAEARR